MWPRVRGGGGLWRGGGRQPQRWPRSAAEGGPLWFGAGWEDLGRNSAAERRQITLQDGPPACLPRGYGVSSATVVHRAAEGSCVTASGSGRGSAWMRSPRRTEGRGRRRQPRLAILTERLAAAMSSSDDSSQAHPHPGALGPGRLRLRLLHWCRCCYPPELQPSCGSLRVSWRSAKRSGC